ncbi:fasciclin-like arabinogalactan protein 1 [Phalaenopsis equestris]|uniref:fasciclin-like arabinogalactan protein 1 n=1 Tax=Phalaenopsis equestris TaxID=78828 RepID=UPI0009E4CAF0|nr:fasciclin-like arabinogalactan protein 1 [Phalaenopsis equestris]
MQPFLRPSILLFLLLLSLIPTSLPQSSPAPQPLTTDDINITDLMSKNGCKSFADLLHSTADAADSFASNIGSGLTAFCPTDPVLKPFLPLFKNLTADQKISLLLYHAIPIYYSIQMLKSNNGVVNTLATDGTTKNYNFTIQNDGDVVTLQTKVTKANITGTLFDKDPVALYAIDEVLEPTEIFKPAEVPVPAPAPQVVADSPKPAGKKQSNGSPEAQSPGDKAADQKAGDNNRAAAAGNLAGVAAVAAFFAFAFV